MGWVGWLGGIRESPPELLPSATRSHLHTNNIGQQGRRNQEEKKINLQSIEDCKLRVKKVLAIDIHINFLAELDHSRMKH